MIFNIASIFCPIEILSTSVPDGEKKCNLVLFNLSDSTISNIKLEIIPTNTSGKPSGKSISSYLTSIHLEESQQSQFTIELPQNITKVMIKVKKVEFENKRVWQRSASLFIESIKKLVEFFIVVLLIFSAYIFTTNYLIPNQTLSKSIEQITKGKYPQAKESLESIKGFPKSKNYLKALEDYFVIQDNYIFYIDKTSNSNIQRLDIKTGIEKTIVTVPCKGFDAIDGAIYYNDAKNNSLNTISYEGTDFKTLVSENATFITADKNNYYFYSPKDDTMHFSPLHKQESNAFQQTPNVCQNKKFIFYTKYNNNNRVYTLTKDNGARKQINNSSAISLNADENFVFYINTSQGNNLYRINIDKSKDEVLRDDDCSSIVLYNNWIYYINNSENSQICRIKTDGSNLQKISKDSASEIVIFNSSIYFVNTNDNKRLYSIKTSGEGLTKLNDSIISNLKIDGDILYYTNLSENDTINKMNLTQK